MSVIFFYDIEVNDNVSLISSVCYRVAHQVCEDVRGVDFFLEKINGRLLLFIRTIDLNSDVKIAHHIEVYK